MGPGASSGIGMAMARLLASRGCDLVVTTRSESWPTSFAHPGSASTCFRSASKAYVLMFTEALQGEYGERGILAMTLCPGGTDTSFAEVANADVDVDDADFNSPGIVAETGLEAFLDGKLYVVPGLGNKSAAFSPRFLSRKRVSSMVGDRFPERGDDQ